MRFSRYFAIFKSLTNPNLEILGGKSGDSLGTRVYFDSGAFEKLEALQGIQVIEKSKL